MALYNVACIFCMAKTIRRSTSPSRAVHLGLRQIGGSRTTRTSTLRGQPRRPSCRSWRGRVGAVYLCGHTMPAERVTDDRSWHELSSKLRPGFTETANFRGVPVMAPRDREVPGYLAKWPLARGFAPVWSRGPDSQVRERAIRLRSETTWFPSRPGMRVQDSLSQFSTMQSWRRTRSHRHGCPLQ
jgi:hypothetical protein